MANGVIRSQGHIGGVLAWKGWTRRYRTERKPLPDIEAGVQVHDSHVGPLAVDLVGEAHHVGLGVLLVQGEQLGDLLQPHHRVVLEGLLARGEDKRGQRTIDNGAVLSLGGNLLLHEGGAGGRQHLVVEQKDLYHSAVVPELG